MMLSPAFLFLVAFMVALMGLTTVFLIHEGAMRLSTLLSAKNSTAPYE